MSNGSSWVYRLSIFPAVSLVLGAAMADLAAIQATLGGFDFQNCQRNGFLAAKGLSFGKVTYSGAPLAAQLSVLKTKDTNE